MSGHFGYYINLDERGEFYADVRGNDGETVWEVHTDGAAQLVEDGFVRDIRDAAQIGQYLISDAGVLPKGAIVHSREDFERDHFTAYEGFAEKDRCVVVDVRALTPEDEMDPEDADALPAIVGRHQYMIHDLERLVREFVPEYPSEMRQTPDEDLARYILEETALDQYHRGVAIAMLEDFQIEAKATPETVAAVKQLLGPNEILRLRAISRRREQELSDAESPSP